MVPSIAGLVVFAGLLVLGRLLGSTIVIGLFASLPFGSTAIVILSALGGSSPVIYTAFVLMLLAWLAISRTFLNDLAAVFSRFWTAWIVGFLALYSLLGAYAFPRLFAGQTTAFVTTPGGSVEELPLAPVSGNITQTGYFVFGALTFFAFLILLRRGGNILTILRRGFVTWAVVHASLGLLDLGGKLVGIPDVLSPIRSASYALLVEVEEVGFWRIAGGFSEASAFGSVSLACLGFAYTYWRVSGSRPMLALTVVLFLLLLFSTSSTAYAGLALVAPFTVIPIAISVLRGRLTTQHIWLFLLGWVGLLAAVGVYIVNENVYEPVIRLFESTVLNKSMSSSATERTYWNSRSIDAFLETGGLGIGLGSSRTSSWVIAVLSQLGVIGALAVASLLGVLLKDLISPRREGVSDETLALVSGARSCVLASLAGASVASGFADPGLLFFVALAMVVTHRKDAARTPEFRSFAALGAR
jgi:hypothetical protein